MRGVLVLLRDCMSPTRVLIMSLNTVCLFRGVLVTLLCVCVYKQQLCHVSGPGAQAELTRCVGSRRFVPAVLLSASKCSLPPPAQAPSPWP